MRLYLPNGMLKRADADLSDLTASQRTGTAYWDPQQVDVLVIPLDPEPTPEEAEAIRRRLVTADADDEAHLSDLLAARGNATGVIERMWVETMLSRYGVTTDSNPSAAASVRPDPRGDAHA